LASCTGHVGEAGFPRPKGLTMGAAARSLLSPLSFDVVAITPLPLHPAGSEQIREDRSPLGESHARVKNPTSMTGSTQVAAVL
jgi:hypothetical protein